MLLFSSSSSSTRLERPEAIRGEYVLPTFVEQLSPELLSVPDTGHWKLYTNTSRQILESINYDTAVERPVVTVHLHIRLLEERQPELLVIDTAAQAKCAGPLQEVSLVPALAMAGRLMRAWAVLVPVPITEEELIVDYSMCPFAITMEDETAYAKSIDTVRWHNPCAY